MDSTEVDVAFSVLPQFLRDNIDRAFDAAIQQSNISNEPPPKRRKFHDDEPIVVGGGGFLTGNGIDDSNVGGFIIDEPQPGGFIVDEPQGGGFVVDSDSEPEGSQPNVQHSRIPLFLIPTACIHWAWTHFARVSSVNCDMKVR